MYMPYEGGKEGHGTSPGVWSSMHLLHDPGLELYSWFFFLFISGIIVTYIGLGMHDRRGWLQDQNSVISSYCD